MTSVEDALFTGAGGPITASGITDALRRIGIVEGDALYVHSDLVHFGRIAMPMLRDRDAFFTAVEDAILTVLGPSGTLLMPTFTTSVLRTGRFNVSATPSETGALSEHFRQRQSVLRTPHPTHSTAVLGARAAQFSDPPLDPFGAGSVFDVLTRVDGKVLLLGADFHWCTYVHHIESQARVGYRKRIAVQVNVEDDQGRRTVHAVRFARPSRYWPDFGRFKARLVAEGICRTTILGHAKIASIPCPAMLRAGLDALDRDARAFYQVRPRLSQLVFDIKGLIARAIRPLRR